MTNFVSRVGHAIQRLRVERRLTQEELAAKAGITRGYLARLETGRHEPTLTTLQRLAKALRVSVVDLIK
jgi:transcriptional regulator with XRE-family HTH domain